MERYLAGLVSSRRMCYQLPRAPRGLGRGIRQLRLAKVLGLPVTELLE
jgi:hypothetical protein